MVIHEEDCGDEDGLVLTKKHSEAIGLNLVDRVRGRFSIGKIVDPATKKVILDKGQLITYTVIDQLKPLDLPEIKVRSVYAGTRRGVCQQCYGWDLAYGRPVSIGTAVGIIAAQSIGGTRHPVDYAYLPPWSCWTRHYPRFATC